VPKSFDDWFVEHVAEVGVGLILADDTELAQFLVRGSAPLSKYQRVADAVCLI